MRSLRASSLRSAMPASFLSAVFWSTSWEAGRRGELERQSRRCTRDEADREPTCFCTSAICSRLRSRKAIFFCWFFELVALMTVL
jgi:hypothetical protein